MNSNLFNDIDIIKFEYKKYNNNTYAPVSISIEIKNEKDLIKFEHNLKNNNLSYLKI